MHAYDDDVQRRDEWIVVYFEGRPTESEDSVTATDYLF